MTIDMTKRWRAGVREGQSRSARFAYRRWEPDAGFLLCLVLERVGALAIDRDHLMPRAAAAERVQA